MFNLLSSIDIPELTNIRSNFPLERDSKGLLIIVERANVSSNVFPFAHCDSQELAANNIIYIYVSKNPMPRDEITSIRFFSSSYVSGVTHTPTLSIRHSCRKIHTYVRIYFRTIQFRRASSLKLHLLQRSIDKTRQLYFSIRRLSNFYEATIRSSRFRATCVANL